MEMPSHTLSSLFAQLGLEHSDEAIERFIVEHRPLASDCPLHQADFWNTSQAEFLAQEIAGDADWADVIDQLNSLLR